MRSIVISIIPRPDADEDLKERLRAFRHELDEFDGGQLPEIMEKVSGEAVAVLVLEGVADDRARRMK